MKTKRETHHQQLETAEAVPGPTAHPICPTSAPCRTLDLSLPLPMPQPFPTEGRHLGTSQERALRQLLLRVETRPLLHQFPQGLPGPPPTERKASECQSVKGVHDPHFIDGA